MKVPLLDLKAQYSHIKPEIDKAISEVMESQYFILGPKVHECELSIAEYAHCSHAVGVSSGSDALMICLMAENIGPGDEVITSTFTFFATVGAIARLGAKPVLVDIDPTTYNLDPTQIASKVTSKTRAIIPVHLYGQMADMDAVMQVAGEHGLIVIEDAAQAIGAMHRNNRAGSVGHYGCFSFFPSKNLGAAGDAGMVVTNDEKRAQTLICLRAHGAMPKYFHRLIGGNFRLDALQAAVISAKLPHLEEWTLARQRNADRYASLFRDSGLRVADSSLYAENGFATMHNQAKGHSIREKVQIFLPKVSTDVHIFNQYVIRVAKRDRLRDMLGSKGIGTEVYYPVPMHLQECFSYLGHRAGAFPESEAAAKETLALPIYPELAHEQAEYVVTCIREFFLASA
jgi:dTDP-4-amino-4,6-dideoxygalactose transaminase